MDNIKSKTLYLRAEINPKEFRTPLIPQDALKLIEDGWVIWIQSSNTRIYSNESYEQVFCKITHLPWYHPNFSSCLILGLKQFEHIEKLNNHTHIYFSHSYQNQLGSVQVLSNFVNSCSILYDLEYFTDYANNRLVSFGYWAGIIGCGLALMEYSNPISNLKPWENFDLFLNDISKQLSNSSLAIGIIGPNGKCGSGSIYLLDLLNLKYNKIFRIDDKSKLTSYDIVINCIKLDQDHNEIWFDSNTLFYNQIIISDISCDNTKSNNPIKIYNNNTTWLNPIYLYNSNPQVKIISIDNLPSLLPKESSDYFSNLLLTILLDYLTDSNNYFLFNYKSFLDISKSIKL